MQLHFENPCHTKVRNTPIKIPSEKQERAFAQLHWLSGKLIRVKKENNEVMKGLEPPKWVKTTTRIISHAGFRKLRNIMQLHFKNFFHFKVRKREHVWTPNLPKVDRSQRRIMM